MSALPWLVAARRRADQPPLRERQPVIIGGAVCGSIEPALAGRLMADGLPVRQAADGCRIDAPAGASLAAIAEWLRRAGLSGRWRGELLAVSDAGGRVVAAVERAVVRVLGISTFAVHLVGVASDGRVWVQQRALDKATDPGLWDTLMGGQVATGESTGTTLARETMEEAGLDIGALAGVRQADRIVVRRPVAEGYLVETIDVFDAVLPHGVEPRNLDGEVERFDLVAIDELGHWLAGGRFTLEATLILGAWLENRQRAG